MLIESSICTRPDTAGVHCDRSPGNCKKPCGMKASRNYLADAVFL